MGSAISSPQADDQYRGVQHNNKLLQPLKTPARPGWFLAGDNASLSWMLNTSKSWCDSSKERVPRSDTYRCVTDTLGRSLLKEELEQLWQKNHRMHGKNDCQASIRVYGYSFQNGQETRAARSTLDLAGKTENS